MKPRHKRLAFVAGGIAALGIVTALLLNVFNSNMVFFFSPSDVLAGKVPVERDFRLGGMVEKGTLEREDDGLTTYFWVTDNHQRIRVTYKGILPDLFREGQGVVAQGQLDKSTGLFSASEVLAKHDEEYMPPEVAEALEKGKNMNKQQLGQSEMPNGGAL